MSVWDEAFDLTNDSNIQNITKSMRSGKEAEPKMEQVSIHNPTLEEEDEQGMELKTNQLGKVAELVTKDQEHDLVVNAEKSSDLNASFHKEHSDLPMGWEATRTTEGRVYYVDHTNKKTSWVHPSRLGQYANLPEGWEARQDNNGKVYYVNHKTKQTSWTNPLLLEQNPNLPEGWEPRLTNDGRVYYVDHTTKKTSWEIPSLLGQKTNPHEEEGEG